MFEYITSNKDWIFSGVGVAITLAIISFVSSYYNNSKEVSDTDKKLQNSIISQGNNNQNSPVINAEGDVSIIINESTKNVETRIEKKLAEALKIYKYEIQWTGGLGEKFKIPRTAKIMDLTVNNLSVEISYKYDDWVLTTKGIMKGFISKNSINGTWNEGGLRGPGTFEFEFSEDFSKAEGWWQLTTNSTKNTWYLYRIK